MKLALAAATGLNLAESGQERALKSSGAVVRVAQFTGLH
jgi:hypothetical protein